MVAISLSFPLGVYYAQSARSPEEPEWPPSPVRLIGALLAAAHRQDGSPDAEREVIERLCGATHPTIVAPPSSPVNDQDPGSVAELRGPSRWAPRNYFGAKGRAQAGVEKVGVALGEQAVTFEWPDLNLSADEEGLLRLLATEIAFLGTSRSPVIATVRTDPADDSPVDTGWQPATEDSSGSSLWVRVPDAKTIAAFDARHALRRSERDRVESAQFAPSPALGRTVAYVPRGQQHPDSSTLFDPEWWGEMLIVPLDTARSEIVPRISASYLVARAMRTALLGAFADPGHPGEAPPILRSRGNDPHCAIVPLADILHRHSKGAILGVAIVLPSGQRVTDLPAQRHRIEEGLASLLRETEDSPQRHLQIPDAGKLFLRRPSLVKPWPATLDRHRYLKASRTWATATPIVHSRWAKKKHGGLATQIQRDLEHVGLPAPERIEILSSSPFPGAATKPVARNRVPPSWRSSMDGPMSHVRLTFDRPVAGPVLIGKARHFGLGLCLPCQDEQSPVKSR